MQADDLGGSDVFWQPLTDTKPGVPPSPEPHSGGICMVDRAQPKLFDLGVELFRRPTLQPCVPNTWELIHAKHCW